MLLRGMACELLNTGETLRPLQVMRAGPGLCAALTCFKNNKALRCNVSCSVLRSSRQGFAFGDANGSWLCPSLLSALCPQAEPKAVSRPSAQDTRKVWCSVCNISTLLFPKSETHLADLSLWVEARPGSTEPHGTSRRDASLCGANSKGRGWGQESQPFRKAALCSRMRK